LVVAQDIFAYGVAWNDPHYRREGG
jgi:hypothetical protein